MKRLLVAATLLGFSAACGSAPSVPVTTAGDDVPVEQGKTHRLTFDDATAGGLPDNLVAPLGDWRVEQDGGAASAPNVLRQKGQFSNPEFPRIVLKDLTFGDLTARVRCRLESGSTDQACGIIFHLEDSDNYLLTRANALEGNIRVYRVVGGRRSQFAGVDRRVTQGQWHDYQVSVRGNQIVVSWDGVEVISTADATFSSGKVGLWTKADSITAFDDFEAVAE